jgi:hypothetical protein
MLPGHIVSVSEQADELRIVMGVRDLAAGRTLGPDGEEVKNLPPGVRVEYVADSTLQAQPDGRFGPPQISTQEGQDKPLRLPGGREVVVGQRYFLNLRREGVELIPHDGNGLRMLDGPMRRRGWGEGRSGGSPPDDGPGMGGERPRNWLRELFENGRERREQRREERRERRGPEGRSGDERGPGERGGEHGPGRDAKGRPQPPASEGRERGPSGHGGNSDGPPPPDDQGPPGDGHGRPPQHGPGPPPDGQGPPSDGQHHGDGQGRPPQEGEPRQPWNG